MRFAIIFALALAVTAQDQRYSSKPPARAGKSKDAKRVKNAIDYTNDGVFLQKAAEDSAFLFEFSLWARTRAESEDVRSTASDLALLESKFGDDLRKLADRKHVTLPERVTDRAHIDSVHAGDTGQSFVEQVLRRYDQEMLRFQAEAQNGSDLDIKTFAADGIAVLQKHRQLVQALQDRLQ
jgi:predicted outer membrane protein